MLLLVKRYFLNFWIWWYVVEARRVLIKLIETWNFLLSFFNVVPMLRNLFQPLYQDFTWVGRVIAFPIRFTWVLVGSFLQLLVTVPLLMFFLFYLAIPFSPFIAVIAYIF